MQASDPQAWQVCRSTRVKPLRRTKNESTRKLANVRNPIHSYARTQGPVFFAAINGSTYASRKLWSFFAKRSWAVLLGCSLTNGGGVRSLDKKSVHMKTLLPALHSWS